MAAPYDAAGKKILEETSSEQRKDGQSSGEQETSSDSGNLGEDSEASNSSDLGRGEGNGSGGTDGPDCDGEGGHVLVHLEEQDQGSGEHWERAH